DDLGCSVLTGMLRGLSVEEARRIGLLDVARALESEATPGIGAPAIEALEDALAALEGRPRLAAEQGRLVCHCFHVHDRRIRRAIAEHGLASVDQVRAFTRANSGCRSCRPDIEALLAEDRARRGDGRGA